MEESPVAEMAVDQTLADTSTSRDSEILQTDEQKSQSETPTRMVIEPLLPQQRMQSSSSRESPQKNRFSLDKSFTGSGTQQLEFYQIIATEESCVNFLRERGLLPGGSDGVGSGFCQKERNGVQCGGVLRDCMRKSRNGSYYKSLRCARKGCMTYVSIRKSNKFFTHTDHKGRCNSGLSISRIVELCWMWANSYPMPFVEQLTGRTSLTINEWYNYCREVCDAIYHLRQPMGGPGSIVYVDEFLCVDKDPKAFDIEAKRGKLPDDENPAKNYGVRTEGPWIIAISLRTQTQAKSAETRFIHVQTRDEETLIPIIQEEIAQGTTVWTDKWYAYAGLSRLGFVHETHKNLKLFTDPISGNRTKCIDRLWYQVKRKFVVKARSSNNLNLHLREEWWRTVNSTDAFNAFLRDVKRVYYADDMDESVMTLLDES